MDEVTVTDADREAAATHSFADTPPETRWLQAGIREGEWDRCELVQAFARHREQSIAPYREALERIVVSVTNFGLNRDEMLTINHDELRVCIQIARATLQQGAE